MGYKTLRIDANNDVFLFETSGAEDDITYNLAGIGT